MLYGTRLGDVHNSFEIIYDLYLYSKRKAKLISDLLFVLNLKHILMPVDIAIVKPCVNRI